MAAKRAKAAAAAADHLERGGTAIPAEPQLVGES
jgi:hypothetical protein